LTASILPIPRRRFYTSGPEHGKKKNTVSRRWLPWRLPVFLWEVAANRNHRRVLGETIRTCRKRISFSQEELAERAGLHHNYIGELERGEKAASIDSLLKIATALKVKVRELVADL
jgi:DNA-binding XRE family transcriptional regulator